MARRLKMRATRKGEIDEDKLAMALLLLAKVLNEHEAPDQQDADEPRDQSEAA